MKLTTHILICLFILPGCASLLQPKDKSLYAKIDRLPLGTAKNQVFVEFGQANKCEANNELEKCSYSLPYKDKNLPLIELTFDATGTLIDKFMILNTDILLLDIKKLKARYPQARFEKVEATYATSNHSYSTDYILQDKTKGLRADYRPNRDNEIQSIRWYMPINNKHKSEVVHRK